LQEEISMKIARIVVAVFAGLVATAPAWGQAAAASYPSRPVRWIIPFTPGASNDIIGRLVAGKLSEAMGQQFIIDNRPGAGGIVGAETVARANPDGYTLILTNPGPNVNNILLRKNPPYQMSDFAPIVWIGYTPFYVMTGLNFPPKTAKEIVDYAKANPGKVSWASSGLGSGPHVALAVFQLSTGINVVHVPYKGTVQPLIDMVAGQIQVLSTTTVSADAQIKAGRIKVLAVQAKKRTAVMPNIPTLEEQGIRNAEAIVWFGMSAPAKTPRAIMDKLNREVNRTLQLADVRQRLDQLGLEVEGGTAEKFDAFIKSEAARLAQLIKVGALQVE
jgi:tripartite-type tricarboxylate transporter receptor subunit TctC